MRRMLFWTGLIVLMVLPIVYGVQIYVTQDLPAVQIWQWMIPAAAVVIIVFFSRNPDDVLKHHVVS